MPDRPRRRTFTAAYKLALLDEYDRCTGDGDKGALLRREGLYSSQVAEWRRARDSGPLAGLEAKRRPSARSRSRSSWPGRSAGPSGPRPSWPRRGWSSRSREKHQSSWSRLLAESTRTDEAAEIADAFGAVEQVSGTRAACGAVGRSRATYYRSRLAPVLGPPAPRPTPPNALDPAEQDAVLGVLRGRFVDAAPAQAWATLFDEGTYLASESTMYRLLRASGEVHERRRQATHPPRTIPELVAEHPNQVWSYDVTKLKGPRPGCPLRPVRHARHLQPLLSGLDGGRPRGRPGGQGLAWPRWPPLNGSPPAPSPSTPIGAVR